MGVLSTCNPPLQTNVWTCGWGDIAGAPAGRIVATVNRPLTPDQARSLAQALTTQAAAVEQERSAA